MAQRAEPAHDPGSGAVGASASSELTDRESAILDFENRFWRDPGAKEEAIRMEFGLSAARYYQLLNALIDTPAAIVGDPMLVRRLQRVRDARVRARSVRSDRTDDDRHARSRD